ncbi:hypothetical protein PAL_GLEAN10017037 [Pteropus alecto]|uniref:Uncharacterized protein n=1 Tax=Pteropus alecto TaxID=9402 RepID=L5JUU7_PTEAL|nr:hypothetical protein PAL_GLEAN10017037 [Pteropus alecto]
MPRAQTHHPLHRTPRSWVLSIAGQKQCVSRNLHHDNLRCYPHTVTLLFDYAMSFECSGQLGYVEELGGPGGD